MSEEIAIKRGAALRLRVVFVDINDVPIDVSGMVVDGQIRTVSDDLVCALSIIATEIIGVALITVTATSAWPVGLLRADLRVVSEGIAVLTETFGIRVNRAVTR